MACSSIDAGDNLDAKATQSLLLELAPYVNKKPDQASFEERFSSVNQPYYEAKVKSQDAEIRYYVERNDTAYFLYVNKDLTSLFEHYRAQGGCFVREKDGAIKYLHLYFHTPRLTKEELLKRGEELFRYTLENKHINAYLGNIDYVKTPNQDFYYNDSLNKWEFTKNSSWRFLKDANQSKEQ